MAPEHEARPRAAVYDHESEEPRRRRRPAADWGVGEDIFDRMPSRRVNRGERRAEHHETAVAVASRDDAAARGAVASRDDDAAARGADVSWDEGAAPRRAAESRGENILPRRAAASWDEDADFGGHLMAAPPERQRAPVESWMDDDARPLVPGESRTIVIGGDDDVDAVEEAEPKVRR